MADINKILKVVNANKSSWIEEDGYELKFNKLNNLDLLKNSSLFQEEGNNVSGGLNLLLNSITDWKNVKVKDVIELDSTSDFTKEELEENVSFHRDLLSAFFNSKETNFLMNVLIKIQNNNSLMKTKEEDLKKN